MKARRLASFLAASSWETPSPFPPPLASPGATADTAATLPTGTTIAAAVAGAVFAGEARDFYGGGVSKRGSDRRAARGKWSEAGDVMGREGLVALRFTLRDNKESAVHLLFTPRG